MTPEEAIYTIKTAQAEIEWEYQTDYEVAFDVAISALEKQIPKKLKTEMLQTIIQGYLYEDRCYICPLCGIFIGNADYQPEKIIKYQFCPNCGQALDWSDGDSKEESK